MELLEALNWRYAVKRMTGNRVPEQKVERIIEAARLSASSMGLQPYNILVVENPEVRKKIQPLAYNQPQIVEASHLLIFAAWEKVTEEHVHEYIERIASTRNAELNSLDGFRDSLLSLTRGHSPEQSFQWAARQTYIAFGTAITAAALEQVDATPMEGFDPVALDEFLDLKAKGLRSVTILALGYRDVENDFLVNSKKVRRDKSQLVLQIA